MSDIDIPQIFNLFHVDQGLAEIRKHTHDPEAAHIIEDKLYLELLTAIAEDRCQHPKECAEVVIESQKMKFARWCA